MAAHEAEGMVAMGLTVEDRGEVRILTIAAPPSNGLTPALRAALISALASVPPTATRIILAASGATFSSGLPLAPDLAAPGLADLCQAVAASPVPVIAALHGLVLGPGAELALAAQGRVAAPGTRIAWPEVALGLCPEGGTSRRLACRIGTAAALDLLLSGRAVGTDEALALGLIDAVAKDPLSTAHSLPVPAAAPDVPRADAAAVAQARSVHSRALPAAKRIIAIVEAAALMPTQVHQAFEAVARDDLEASPEAAALRSVALAERRVAALPPELARLRPAAPDRIALHGAAPELVTLARLALARGVAVAWHHPDPKTAAASLVALDLAEASEQRAGRLSAAARTAGRARLQAGGDAPVHIHADPSALTADGAHLLLGGSETSLGLALAPLGPSAELSLPPGCPPEGAALALALLRRLGLPPVLAGPRPILGRGLVIAGRSALAWLAATGVPQARIAAAMAAFGAPVPEGLPDPDPHGPDALTHVLGDDEILARWLGALANEGLRLLDQGIARRPSDIDLVLVAGHGFPRWRGGPMHLADRRGLMALRADLRLWAADDPIWAPAPLLDRLIRDDLRLDALDLR